MKDESPGRSSVLKVWDLSYKMLMSVCMFQSQLNINLHSKYLGTDLLLFVIEGVTNFVKGLVGWYIYLFYKSYSDITMLIPNSRVSAHLRKLLVLLCLSLCSYKMLFQRDTVASFLTDQDTWATAAFWLCTWENLNFSIWTCSSNILTEMGKTLQCVTHVEWASIPCCPELARM